MQLKKNAILLKISELKPAAKLVAAAFQNDPFFTFMIPDTIRRHITLSWLFEKITLYGILYGKVYTTAALEGVAIWLGPQLPGLSLPGILRTGLFRLPEKLNWREFIRSSRMASFAEKLHKKNVVGRHWYLYELAVDPLMQGQGVGSILLQPILEQATRESLPCYLDTYNKKNLAFYIRNGFSIIESGQANKKSPHIWAMRCEPI